MLGSGEMKMKGSLDPAVETYICFFLQHDACDKKKKGFGSSEEVQVILLASWVFTRYRERGSILVKKHTAQFS